MLDPLPTKSILCWTPNNCNALFSNINYFTSHL